MNAADHAEATRRDDPPPRFPSLQAAEVFRIRFKRARRLMIEGRIVPVEEAAVIEVTTDVEWPAMGTGLALFVDGTPLVESELLAPQRYRFIAPPGATWKSGASLALGLAGSGSPRTLSPSKLKLPALDARASVRQE